MGKDFKVKSIERDEKRIESRSRRGGCGVFSGSRDGSMESIYLYLIEKK